MSTFLFDEIIFGPVASRRLGNSLGINLLPTDTKYCNFNCLYCECGLTAKNYATKRKDLPPRDLVKKELERTLNEFRNRHRRIDTITFAGNGEPTLHPEFAEIIDDTIVLKNIYFPNSKIAVLSNATLLGNEKIFRALYKVDYNILKLDSAFDDTLQKINCPLGNFSVSKLVAGLRKFPANLTIQTLFVRGEYNGYFFDNTTDKEIDAWLEILKELKPDLVMVYTIARDTPIDSIRKVEPEKLDEIARKVKESGIPVTVSA
jgi:wyosine [tRNA(Phe)-imidazoG37] synthetase (radical SAM superfamily)